jgi:hypothetical protein
MAPSGIRTILFCPCSSRLTGRGLSAGPTQSSCTLTKRPPSPPCRGSPRGATSRYGIDPKALWEAMSRSGKSLADMGRSDTTAKIEGKTKGIIQIPRGLDGDHGSAYLPSAARIGDSPRTPARAVTAVTKNPR